MEAITPKTAKGQAVLDIKIELNKEGKCFISFSKALTPAIKDIVKEYLKRQEAL